MTTSRLPLSSIDPDPDNVRTDLGDLTELRASIVDHGLLQPLIVYPTGDGRYRCAGGHRRRAVLLELGHGYVDVILRDPPASTVDRLDLLTAENFNRSQLNPVEEARVYARYRDAGLDQVAIAKRVGRAQSHVSTYLLFLTELTRPELRRLAAGEITPAAAKKLMQRRRADEGRARSDIGGAHASGGGTWVAYFNRSHPLAVGAAARCDRERHTAERIGPACGACWERTIRDDEAARMPAASVAVDPRAGGFVTALICTRCGTSRTADNAHQPCAVDAQGRRFLFAEHSFERQQVRTEAASA